MTSAWSFTVYEDECCLETRFLEKNELRKIFDCFLFLAFTNDPPPAIRICKAAFNFHEL